MAKAKFGYGWVIKWILAAILIAAGVLMKIYDEEIVYDVIISCVVGVDII